MTRIQLFRDALSRTMSLGRLHPANGAMLSIAIQLDYLIDFENGVHSSRGRLDDLIIGVLAVREIEPLDQSLAKLLCEVQEQVEHMKAERKGEAPE
jgi:hypothetical protein